MSTMGPVPNDDPRMSAWVKFIDTDDFAHACELPHERVHCGMWAVFNAGWEAAVKDQLPIVVMKHPSGNSVVRQGCEECGRHLMESGCFKLVIILPDNVSIETLSPADAAKLLAAPTIITGDTIRVLGTLYERMVAIGFEKNACDTFRTKYTGRTFQALDVWQDDGQWYVTIEMCVEIPAECCQKL